MCWNDLGPAGARDLLNNTQIIINYWLLHHGFSVGVSDIVASQVGGCVPNRSALCGWFYALRCKRSFDTAQVVYVRDRRGGGFMRKKSVFAR